MGGGRRGWLGKKQKKICANENKRKKNRAKRESKEKYL
jgi:hypothetical protein